MALRFINNPSPLKFPGFEPYSWKELRNQLLFRLLARHGSLVASALEFTALDAVDIEFKGKKVPAHGQVKIKVNTPTKREFFHAPYLVNPYQPQSENGFFKWSGWQFAQPLILGGSRSDAELAQATLKLDIERMKNGPFSQEPFANEYEFFKVPVFRYFAKHKARRTWLVKMLGENELKTGMLDPKTCARLKEYLPDSMVSDLDDTTPVLVSGASRTLLQHLLVFHEHPEQYPKEWSTYLGSKARQSHHMYKSHQRLVSHYTQLEERVGETDDDNSRPLTEARGEYLAAKVMAMIFAGDLFELKMGFGDRQKAQGIDQIWARRDTKTNNVEAYFVIECKGSKSAKHGQNKEETQMSPGWVFKKLVELASDDSEEEKLQRLAQNVLSAMFDEASPVAVFGMTIKSIFDKDHTYQTATRFNVQISKQLRFPTVLQQANTQADTLDDLDELFGSSAFPPVKSAEIGILEKLPASAMKFDVPKDVRFFNFNGVLDPDHQRNKRLFSLLTAHAASILSVQDYFGVEPHNVKIDGGKLHAYTAFATTAYGGNNAHQHGLISTLVDPYDQDSTGSGALLLESNDKEEAKRALAWKQKALKTPNTSRPKWMASVANFTDSERINGVLLFFAKRPWAREELQRIWKGGMVDEPAEETVLAFPNLPQSWFTWKSGNTKLLDQVLAMKFTWDRFTSHENKSLKRLGQHYQSLQKELTKNTSKTVLTEVSGEYLGARAMAVIFGKDRLQLKMGHGEKQVRQGVDQIWAKRDPTTGDVVAYFLVECKGSKGAELGQNVHETQMSPAWIFQKMLELAKEGGRLSRLSQKVLSALFEPTSKAEVYGVIIQSLFDPKKGTGGRFNIRLTSRLFFPDMLELANVLYQKNLGTDGSKLYSRILHERMPLSTFLPDYASTRIPVKKSSLVGKQYTNPSRHKTCHNYPLTVQHVQVLAVLGTKEVPLVTWDVPADGDCAYITVQKFLEKIPGLLGKLGLTTLPTLEELKGKVVAEINTSPDFARGFLEEGQSLEQLKTKVKERHAFFGAHGDIVLPSLARQLGLGIHVIHPSGFDEDLDVSFGLNLPVTAPKVYAVLTTYMGNPGSIAHYYPALPQRLRLTTHPVVPSGHGRGQAIQSGSTPKTLPLKQQQSKKPGSTPKTQQPQQQQTLKRKRPQNSDAGGSKGTDHGDPGNNKQRK
ncbi:hypothetical protein [Hyalangium versicolor]|uniref:hypothetical protein n=1 Tax=Hyalangium versicolor TaxID=2861190 RepID=UPI001CCAC38F|nr:hypothetical protein [Hyalangium versicolor]